MYTFCLQQEQTVFNDKCLELLHVPNSLFTGFIRVFLQNRKSSDEDRDMNPRWEAMAFAQKRADLDSQMKRENRNTILLLGIYPSTYLHILIKTH